MKKSLLVIGMVFVFVLSGFASEKSNKFRIDELVFLPHPGKFIKQGKIKITKEQKQKIAKEVKAVYAPIFQDKIRAAFKVEKQVRRLVEAGKTKEELQPYLDQIMKLKREAMDSRIDALNKIKNILSEKEWEKVNTLTYR
jgi:Spy/CpxP family protein refolding chaperone